jgi:hypothetical protein
MDHDLARTKVCLLCFRKGSFSILEKPDLITTIHQLIQDYDEYDRRLPTSLCASCRTALYNLKSGSDVNKFQCLNKLEVLLHKQRWISPRLKNCQCAVCEVANANGLQAKKLKSSLKRGRPKLEGSDAEVDLHSSRDFKLCGSCFSRLYRGCRHECTHATKIHNIHELTTEKEKEKVASDILKDKTAGSSSTTCLNTDGRPLTVTLEKPKSKTSHTDADDQISHKDIKAMQTHCGLTQNQTLKVCGDLRIISKNRKIIEPRLRDSLHESNLLFEDVFKIAEINGHEGVFCSDVAQLIERVSAERGHAQPPVLFKLGLDSGRGTLKASASFLFSGDPLLETGGPPSKKKRTFEDDILGHFKDSGVKKLLLLGISTNTSEDYANLEKFLGALDLNSEQFSPVLCADLKVINCALGIMPCASRHPCPYCHWVKGSKKQNFELRTFEGIVKFYEEWKSMSNDPAKLKDYFNCRNIPLSIFPKEGEVINHIPLSELHLLIGIVNKMFSELLLVYPTAVQWPQKLHLVKEKYHHAFEGNECHMLLKKTQVLWEMIQAEPGDPNSHPAALYVAAFQTFGKVVHSCFGRELLQGWQDDVREFCGAYLKLGISLTPKFHIVRDHIIPFCSLKNCGLSRFSEQAFESVHADFAKFAERHHVKDKTNKLHIVRLKQTVLEYNASHV